MMADVWTVMWKEFKELFVMHGSLRRSILTWLIFVGGFGILIPLQMGHEWVESPLMLIIWPYASLFMVMSVIADSFAGERERHTLETLLASRLPDGAILYGKVGAVVGYGWGMSIIALLLGLVTVNVAYAQGELLLYPANMGLSILIFSLLGTGLAAGVGVLVSLRAATVRQAHQTLVLPIILLSFVPSFGIQVLSAEWRMYLFETLMTADVPLIVLVAAICLTLLDTGLLLAARARFRRARLILD